MATSWIDTVKNTKQLTVFATGNVTQRAWASVFTNALQEFNRLSTTMKLGVTLTQTTTPPDMGGLGGANVSFDTLAGKVTDTYQGTQFSVSIIGTGMSGETKNVMTEAKNGVRQIKAFIYVPSAPSINVPLGGKPIQRGVGDPVKLVIAVHELLHACGLSNADHSPSTDPDVFISQPQPSPGAAKKPQDDKLELRPSPQLLLAPPIFLTARTADLIRGIWKEAQSPSRDNQGMGASNRH
jgi:hypothetical protein